MALDLVYTIRIEHNDAKRALAEVEQAMKGIEGASVKTAPAVSKVTEAAKKSAEGTSKASEATKELTTSTKAYENAALKTATAVGLLNAGQVQAVKGASSVAAAVGLSTAAMTAMAGSVLVVVAAFGAMAGLLVKSVKHYFDTADATRDSRDALRQLADTFEYAQKVIGHSILGGSFSIVKPVEALNMALIIATIKGKEAIGQVMTLLKLVTPKSVEDAFTKGAYKPDKTDYVAEVQQQAMALAGLTKEGRKQLEAAIMLGEKQDVLKEKFGLTAVGVGFFKAQLSEAKREQAEIARESERLAKVKEREAAAWNKLTKELKDWAATQKANMLLPGFTQAISQSTLDNAALIAWGKAEAEKRQGTYAVGPELMLGETPWTTGLSDETIAQNYDSITRIVNPWRESFTQLGRDLPGILFGSMMSGGSVAGMVVNAAAGIGSHLMDSFQKALEKADGDMSKLGGKTKLMGLAATGIGAAIEGYSIGAQMGSKGKGAAAGAASGAALGTMVMPGIGSAVGAGIGAIAGFFGGRSAEKQAREQMQQQRDEWVAQYGGMDKLKTMADKLGVSLGNAFTTKKPEEFYRVVERVNVAIEKQKNLYEGIDKLTAGVNARASVFAETATAASQDEFNRLGSMGFAAFGANMKTHGSPLEALAAMKPTLDAITAAQKEYNFTASESVQRLLDINAVVTNNSGAFQALAADSQILQGAIQANWKDMDLFKAVSTDVAIQIGNITANGVPMAQALALNQPVLQSLWEAQQKFHFETDEATQALLDQAKEQGLVGANMKNVNEKILDVLVLIADQLGAKIPDAMRTMEDAARDTAAGMNEAFDSVRGPNVGDGSGGSPDTYHAGGPIRFAHSGGLGPDEFPVIAQSGEFMMRRSAVDKYGVGFMRSVNNGTAGGGVTIQINNPVVRDDRDLNDLTDKIMQRLPKRLTRAGL
jgi:hypothetical protein